MHKRIITLMFIFGASLQLVFGGLTIKPIGPKFGKENNRIRFLGHHGGNAYVLTESKKQWDILVFNVEKQSIQKISPQELAWEKNDYLHWEYVFARLIGSAIYVQLPSLSGGDTYYYIFDLTGKFIGKTPALSYYNNDDKLSPKLLARVGDIVIRYDETGSPQDTIRLPEKSPKNETRQFKTYSLDDKGEIYEFLHKVVGEVAKNKDPQYEVSMLGVSSNGKRKEYEVQFKDFESTNTLIRATGKNEIVLFLYYTQGGCKNNMFTGEESGLLTSSGMLALLVDKSTGNVRASRKVDLASLVTEDLKKCGNEYFAFRAKHFFQWGDGFISIGEQDYHTEDGRNLGAIQVTHFDANLGLKWSRLIDKRSILNRLQFTQNLKMGYSLFVGRNGIHLVFEDSKFTHRAQNPIKVAKTSLEDNYGDAKMLTNNYRQDGILASASIDPTGKVTYGILQTESEHPPLLLHFESFKSESGKLIVLGSYFRDGYQFYEIEEH